MRLFSFWTFAIVLYICIQNTRTFDGCLCVEEFANGLQLPIELVHANDGSNRKFVVELKGIVNVYTANGTKLPQPLIDVSAKIGYLGKAAESGLTSMAFHPNFKYNGLFYMLVSTKSNKKGIDHYSNVFEFKISASDNDKADPNYSRLLLKFGQPVWAHDADQPLAIFCGCTARFVSDLAGNPEGRFSQNEAHIFQLLFGIDNYLYVFIGDGGFQGDPKMFSQNMDKYFGKILRIDVDSRTGNLPYGIPQDNPFNNGSYPKPEIYALGFRNPWRAGMDLGDRLTGEGRGRIIIGDVGQDRVEELDLLEKGANYEWNIKEGTTSHCWKKDCLKGPGKFTPPIFSYARSTKLGKSIIGGQFYRGCRSPKLNGIYFWGDYYSGLLFRLKENKATGTWQNKEVDMCNSKVCQHPLKSTFTGHMTSFGLDKEGELYMMSSEGRHPYKKKGYVYRLVEPSQPGDPEPCTVSATQQATEVKPIFQNHQNTNLNEAKSEEPKVKTTTTTATTKSTTTTTTTTTTPKPTTSLTTKPTKLPTPTPPENGNLGSDGSSVQTDEDLSPSDESNGNSNIKETLARFLGKLLARLYNADFSNQDEDSTPQA